MKWPTPFTFDGELAGVWSFEREIDSLALYGRLIIIAPDHRGAKLAAIAMKGTENLGRAMGAAFLYAMATLKIPHAQRALEGASYRLLGFFPGYDREEVAPGVVKRVYQAVYAKLLVPEDEVLRPAARNLTPRALYGLLFADVPATLVWMAATHTLMTKPMANDDFVGAVGTKLPGHVPRAWRCGASAAGVACGTSSSAWQPLTQERRRRRAKGRWAMEVPRVN